jgi:hypothetical protein
MIFKGKYIVFSLFLLTSIFGSLFIYMGPKVLETSPGVLQLGIRFSDEFSVAFTQHPKGGPGASLEIFDSSGRLIDSHTKLIVGRNLIPIDQDLYNNQIYTFKISSPGYETVILKAENDSRLFKPLEGYEMPHDVSFKPNLLGMKLQLKPEDALSF